MVLLKQVLILSFELQERKKYIELFPAVICDSFAHHNIAFRMTKSGLLEVLLPRTLISYFHILMALADMHLLSHCS